MDGSEACFLVGGSLSPSSGSASRSSRFLFGEGTPSSALTRESGSADVLLSSFFIAAAAVGVELRDRERMTLSTPSGVPSRFTEAESDCAEW